MNDFEPINITEPCSIRTYVSGGKGGYGSSSSPLHRLVQRRRDADVAACGRIAPAGTKIAVTNGAPKPALARKYGLCEKCWTA